MNEDISRVTLKDLQTLTSNMKQTFSNVSVAASILPEGTEDFNVLKITTSLQSLDNIVGYIEIVGTGTNDMLDSRLIINYGSVYIFNLGPLKAVSVFSMLDQPISFYIRFNASDYTKKGIVTNCSVNGMLLQDAAPVYKAITSAVINPESPDYSKLPIRYIHIGSENYNEELEQANDSYLYNITEDKPSFALQTNSEGAKTYYSDGIVFDKIQKSETADKLSHNVTFKAVYSSSNKPVTSDLSEENVIINIPPQVYEPNGLTSSDIIYGFMPSNGLVSNNSGSYYTEKSTTFWLSDNDVDDILTQVENEEIS